MNNLRHYYTVVGECCMLQQLGQGTLSEVTVNHTRKGPRDHWLDYRECIRFKNSRISHIMLSYLHLWVV